MVPQRTNSKKKCAKCSKNVKIYVNCSKCNTIYHAKCLLEVPGVQVDKKGQPFCCQNITSKRDDGKKSLATGDSLVEIVKEAASGFDKVLGNCLSGEMKLDVESMEEENLKEHRPNKQKRLDKKSKRERAEILKGVSQRQHPEDYEEECLQSSKDEGVNKKSIEGKSPKYDDIDKRSTKRKSGKTKYLENWLSGEEKLNVESVEEVTFGQHRPDKKKRLINKSDGEGDLENCLSGEKELDVESMEEVNLKQHRSKKRKRFNEKSKRERDILKEVSQGQHPEDYEEDYSKWSKDESVNKKSIEGKPDKYDKDKRSTKRKTEQRNFLKNWLSGEKKLDVESMEEVNLKQHHAKKMKRLDEKSKRDREILKEASQGQHPKDYEEDYLQSSEVKGVNKKSSEGKSDEFDDNDKGSTKHKSRKKKYLENWLSGKEKLNVESMEDVNLKQHRPDKKKQLVKESAGEGDLENCLSGDKKLDVESVEELDLKQYHPKKKKQLDKKSKRDREILKDVSQGQHPEDYEEDYLQSSREEEVNKKSIKGKSVKCDDKEKRSTQRNTEKRKYLENWLSGDEKLNEESVEEVNLKKHHPDNRKWLVQKSDRQGDLENCLSGEKKLDGQSMEEVNLIQCRPKKKKRLDEKSKRVRETLKEVSQGQHPEDYAEHYLQSSKDEEVDKKSVKGKFNNYDDKDKKTRKHKTKKRDGLENWLSGEEKLKEESMEEVNLNQHRPTKEKQLVEESNRGGDIVRVKSPERHQEDYEGSYLESSEDEGIHRKTTTSKLDNYGDKDERYQCKDCKYSVDTREALLKHVCLHKKPFKCDECDFATTRKFNLSRHTLTQHSNKDEKRYKCESCEYSTDFKSRLAEHMPVHAKEKPFKCDKCDYSAGRKRDLNNHISSRHVTEEKKYHCESCEYSTHDKTSLDRHERIHLEAEEKPFQCDQCDYATIYESWLEVHVRAKHSTEEKAYKCEECEYSSHKKSHLVRHVQVHTKEKPFKCDMCKYAAYEKHRLNSHKLTKHSDCIRKG